MKTLLLTAFCNKMMPLGRITAPLMLDYAAIHRMDFKCVRNFPKGIPGYWQKLPSTIQAFDEGYDRVIWLDIDQVITNPYYVPPFETGFHASMDWGADATDKTHFSMCGYVACRNSKRLFDWIIDHQEEYVNGEFPDQKPMRQLATLEEYKPIFTIHPRRVFNSVPKEVHKSVVEPWENGDWLCHVTMLPVEDRVNIVRTIRDQVIMKKIEEVFE